jgi:chromate transporter
MRNTLWLLFAVFAPLSLVTVGGGQAVVADIQRQVVDTHHWLTSSQFLNDFAISRMAPGPGSLLVTLIGWQVAGIAGAVVATAGIFAPTAVLMFGVAEFWSRFRGRRWQVALEAGLRPVAAGMILAAVLVLLRSLDGGWPAVLIALGSTTILLRTRVNPLLLLGLGAAALVACHAAGLLGR